MLVAGDGERRGWDLGVRRDLVPVEPQIRIHEAVVDLAVGSLEPDEVPLALDHPEEDDRLHAGGKVGIERLAFAVDVAVPLFEGHEVLVGDEPVHDTFAHDHTLGQDLEEVGRDVLLTVGVDLRVGEVGRHGQLGVVERPGVSVGDQDPVLILDDREKPGDVGAGVEPDLVLVGDPDEDLVEPDRIDPGPVAGEIVRGQTVPENRLEVIVGKDPHDVVLATLFDDLADPQVPDRVVRHVTDFEILSWHISDSFVPRASWHE